MNTCKCLLCEKEMVKDHGNPMGGTIWATTGNFGSTVYDNVGYGSDESLVAYICDECLVAKHSLILQRTVIVDSSASYEPFNPNKEHGT